MVRSLWSGVSGLQAHQTAIDVEAHNIANVNTNGFKYSRANFAELISQNHRYQTAPYGYEGGQNGKQVGLGTSIPTTTRIYKDGDLQETDRTMDIAIRKNGFFVVSNNDGRTYQYTRDGAFGFDADGNLVTNSGMIVQGWNRSIDGSCYDANDKNFPFYNRLEGSPDITGKDAYGVDTTGVVEGIKINPDAKISACPTEEVKVTVNLNSSNKIEQKKSLYATRTDNPQERDGWDWVDNGTVVDDLAAPFDIAANNIDLNDMFDQNSERFNLVAGQGVRFDIVGNATAGAQTNTITLTYGTGANQFNTLNEMLTTIENAANVRVSFVNGEIVLNAPAGAVAGSTYTVRNVTPLPDNNANAAKNYQFVQLFEDLSGQTYNNTTPIRTTPITGKVLQTIDDMAILHNKEGVEFELESARSNVPNTGQGVVIEFDHYNRDIALPAGTANPSRVTFRYTDGGANSPAVTNVNDLSIPPGQAGSLWRNATATRKNSQGEDETYNVTEAVVYFKTNEDLRKLMNNIVVDQDHNGSTDPNIDTEVLWNDDGTLRVVNNGNDNDFPISLKIDKIADTKENKTFYNVMKGLEGVASTGRELVSNEVHAAFFATSIDVYDSLGSKHTLRMEFRKNDLNEWDFRAILPRPANIVGAQPEGNILRGGRVNFDVDGSFISATPPNLTFTAGNGSEVLQTFKFNFGKTGEFGGITGFDYKSSQGALEQDGYAGGELQDVYFDDSGKIIGSFNNGRSIALARIAIADFENQEGLQVQGSNLLTESSNSGEAHIGLSGFGGRGLFKAKSLEKSNTDLSRSLSQLIVIQRAYQAQTKIITTSDQMLQTLLQIKQ